MVGHQLLDACGGSARLREAGWKVAPSTAPRQPYLFCPVLRRALCSGSRAFSRLVCVGAAERWEGSLAWRGGLAWWVAGWGVPRRGCSGVGTASANCSRRGAEGCLDSGERFNQVGVCTQAPLVLNCPILPGALRVSFWSSARVVEGAARALVCLWLGAAQVGVGACDPAANSMRERSVFVCALATERARRASTPGDPCSSCQTSGRLDDVQQV